MEWIVSTTEQHEGKSSPDLFVFYVVPIPIFNKRDLILFLILNHTILIFE